MFCVILIALSSKLCATRFLKVTSKYNYTSACTFSLLTSVKKFDNQIIRMGSSNTKQRASNKVQDTGKMADEFVEGIVCQESDLKEDEMKVFGLGDGKVLVVKQGGKVSAIGAKCTHYGAPLVTGVLGKGRVRCPWHGACFRVDNGDIEDFPGLDSLPCYEVELQPGGEVKVRARKSELQSGKRVKPMAERDASHADTIIVIGGGAAGSSCVETLRQEGFAGRVVMVCQEPHRPYDRIKLSKALDATGETLALRQPDFYQEHGIEVLTGTEVVSLDVEARTVRLGSGELIPFSAVFVATGASPRQGMSPGSELANIFALRTAADANLINAQLGPDKNVVVVGSSFIGMEVAAYCVGKCSSVTVVGRGAVPFGPVLGQAVGGRLMDMFLEKGVKFRMNCKVSSFLGEGKVGSVLLDDGASLPADVVVLGLGATPNTGLLEATGVQLDRSGAVVVDEFLESSVKGIYAGGDIAHAPVLGGWTSIGHWQLATYHGHMAGLNIAGHPQALNTVPFFWTMLFGKGVRYAGYAPDFDDVIIHGSLPELKFVAYYCLGPDVRAVATSGRDPLAAKFAELLAEGRKLSKDQIADEAWAQ